MTRGSRCNWTFSLAKVLIFQGLILSPRVQGGNAVISYSEGSKADAKLYECGVNSFMG